MTASIYKGMLGSSMYFGELSIPYILQNSLGFYWFRSYLKDIKHTDIDALKCLEHIDKFIAVIQVDTEIDSRVKEAKTILDFCLSEPSIIDALLAKEKESISPPSTYNLKFHNLTVLPEFYTATGMRCKGKRCKCDVAEEITSVLLSDMNASLKDRSGTIKASFFNTLYCVIIKNLATTHWSNYIASSQCQSLISYWNISQQKASDDEFVPAAVLGRGGFGLVHACVRRDTGKVYAMKIMNKKRVKNNAAEDLCMGERAILRNVNSPFVVSLRYAFTTPTNAILVMDIMTGGDLFYHLGKVKRFNEERARFYAAQVLLGIEHLHSQNIVYRDLKCQNILLAPDGNCKITDLGLAVQLPDKRCKIAGVAGTRGYWAPEVLKSRKKPAAASNTATTNNTVALPALTPIEVTTSARPSLAQVFFESRTSKVDALNYHHRSSARNVSSVVNNRQQSFRVIDGSPIPMGPGSLLRETNNTVPLPPTGRQQISNKGGDHGITDPPRSKYGKECDWWSYGCLIYEMLYGKCPFRLSQAKSLDPDEKKSMDKATLEWEPPYDDKCFNPTVKDLIKKLLMKDPEKRLGACGAREIKQHPWFNSIDWDAMVNGRAMPPWKPDSTHNVANKDEIGEFAEVNVKLDEIDHAKYSNWYYCSAENVSREIVEFLTWQDRGYLTAELPDKIRKSTARKRYSDPDIRRRRDSSNTRDRVTSVDSNTKATPAESMITTPVPSAPGSPNKIVLDLVHNITIQTNGVNVAAEAGIIQLARENDNANYINTYTGRRKSPPTEGTGTSNGNPIIIKEPASRETHVTHVGNTPGCCVVS